MAPTPVTKPPPPFTHPRWRVVELGVAVALVLHLAFSLIGAQAPNGLDWHLTLRPVIVDLILQGQSPYLHPYFHSPPWAIIPLIPFAFLPVGVDSLALYATTLAAFAYAAWRLGARPITLALLVTSPAVLNVAGNGQMDWLVPLGLLMPRPLGLFFVLSKPQIGVGIAIYWLVESWRRGGARQVAIDFGAIGIAGALSLYFFHRELFEVSNLLGSDVSWNISFWPYSIPIGLALLLSALRQRKPNLALTAGAFFSPYVAIYAWSIPILGLIDDQLIMCVVLISLRFVYVLR